MYFNFRAQEPRVDEWLENMETDFLVVKLHGRVKHKKTQIATNIEDQFIIHLFRAIEIHI